MKPPNSASNIDALVELTRVEDQAVKTTGTIVIGLVLAVVISACNDSDIGIERVPEEAAGEDQGMTAPELNVVTLGLFPRLVTQGDSVLSVSGSPIDRSEVSAFDSLEFDAESRIRFRNADGSETFLPEPPVDNALLRSVHRIVDISVMSSADYSPSLLAGSELSSVVQIELIYRQLDGAPFAILADGTVNRSSSNPFESPVAIEARQAEMPTEFAVRLIEAPAIAALHEFTLFVSLDDGRQLEVSWPALMVE